MIKSFISLTDSISRDGFALLRGVVTSSELDNLGENIHSVELEKLGAAGLRLLLKKSKAVRRFAQSEAMISIAETVLGAASKPVKAIFFDKTAETNWYVTWHQDLTIATKKRIEIEGFGPWSVKQGIPHVQAPALFLSACWHCEFILTIAPKTMERFDS